jgi:hypothetical protein
MHNILKKISALLGYIVFFALVFSGYDFGTPFDIITIYPLIFRAILGAVIFWFATLIVGDIIIKGVVSDIEKSDLEPLEGGFEQQIFAEKSKNKIKVIKKIFKRVDSK